MLICSRFPIKLHLDACVSLFQSPFYSPPSWSPKHKGSLLLYGALYRIRADYLHQSYVRRIHVHVHSMMFHSPQVFAKCSFGAIWPKRLACTDIQRASSDSASFLCTCSRSCTDSFICAQSSTWCLPSSRLILFFFSSVLASVLLDMHFIHSSCNLFIHLSFMLHKSMEKEWKKC